MDLHYRVKFIEGFKDGNIFDKEIPAGTTIVIAKNLYDRAVQSGAVVENLETLVPNPKRNAPPIEELPEDVEVVKHDIALPVVGQEPEAEKFEAKHKRWAEEDGTPLSEDSIIVRKKRGRPRKGK